MWASNVEIFYVGFNDAIEGSRIAGNGVKGRGIYP
jgi:hypothetical protein